MTLQPFRLSLFVAGDRPTKTEIQDFAIATMKHWSDEGVLPVIPSFRFSHAKKWQGQFKVRGPWQEIAISSLYAAHATTEDIEDTVLHEIAHAIAWQMEGYIGHGRKWLGWAHLIGCSGDVVGARPDSFPRGRYVAECPTCGMTGIGYRWVRPTTEFLHGRCRQDVVWVDLQAA